MQTPSKPRASNYPIDDGMHAAMRQWAAAQARPTAHVEVAYSDSTDTFNESFDPATEEVEYKTRDGEVYTVSVDTGKYSALWLYDKPMTYRELRQRMETWLRADLRAGVTVVSINWKRGKN